MVVSGLSECLYNDTFRYGSKAEGSQLVYQLCIVIVLLVWLHSPWLNCKA